MENELLKIQQCCSVGITRLGILNKIKIATLLMKADSYFFLPTLKIVTQFEIEQLVVCRPLSAVAKR